MTNSPSSPSTRIRVLIVDDHAVVRQGLRTFLELQDDSATENPSEQLIEVVGEAADGDAAVALAACLQPDIVLLDLVMPGLGGLQATPRILHYSPGSRVLILTSFGEEDKVIPAIRAGAYGYLLKDIQPTELIRSIRLAFAGQVQLHPEVAKKLLSAVAAGEEASPYRSHKAGLGEMTARELEVLRLIAQGLNNRQIAARMVISEKTVKTHVSSILNKLGLEDRTQAAIYALRHGLAEDKA